MSKLLAYVHEQLSNRDVFPIDEGALFPEESERVAQQLSRRMFRVYAHAYLSHFARVQEENLEAELNFCYKHFLYFVKDRVLAELTLDQAVASGGAKGAPIKEFDLVGDRELLPLHELNKRWLALPAAVPEAVPAELRG
ncbi:unnamed protein product [Prorocentrum cordatum]|uniref:Uncharacterized protein n=1 Tax=Prorocentrum cordatum TaxID=2364126 RepID=A0ABN9Y8F7_9DINO|nr:unnamed protein product [Polarella glacialis]